VRPYTAAEAIKDLFGPTQTSAGSFVTGARNGGAVQVDSIKIQVESIKIRVGFSA